MKAVDIETIRAHCLSLPHATEDLKPEWGDALLFRVAGKIFVSVSLGSVPVMMNVKCTPERCAELLEIEGVWRADYVGRYNWVTFAIGGVFRDGEIRGLIAESYENIRAKLPNSAMAKLQSGGPKQRAARKGR